jgi:hypothetical protein
MLKKSIVGERKSTAKFNKALTKKKYSSEAHSTRAKMDVYPFHLSKPRQSPGFFISQ